MNSLEYDQVIFTPTGWTLPKFCRTVIESHGLPHEFYVQSFGFSKASADDIYNMFRLADSKIKIIIVDVNMFGKKNARNGLLGKIVEALPVGTEICGGKVHSKFILFGYNNKFISIVTSANFENNRSEEFYIISYNQKTYQAIKNNFYKLSIANGSSVNVSRSIPQPASTESPFAAFGNVIK